MSDAVAIDRRFRGPPESANGGYACGLVASFVDAPVIEARLQVPPPLDTPLEPVVSADGAELRLGETVVARARPASLDLEIPDPVPFDEARAAGEACPWSEEHTYPYCFVCGPHRDPPDGLHVLMGPLDDRRLVADVWVPDPSVADEEGTVDPLVVWGALDCPSAWGFLWYDRPDAPVLLGSLTAELIEPLRAGERYVVMGWTIGHEGRKHFGGSAIFADGGGLVGRASGLWIETRPAEA